MALTNSKQVAMKGSNDQRHDDNSGLNAKWKNVTISANQQYLSPPDGHIQGLLQQSRMPERDIRNS